MNVVDLSQARQAREAARQVIEDAASGISDEITSMAVRHADWAFGVAGPLAPRDPEIAKMVYRGVRRRLLCQVRRESLPQIRSLTIEWAARVYRARLIERIEERDGLNGGAA